MGLLDAITKNQKPRPLEVTSDPGALLAPVGGSVVALSEVPDPVFAEGMLGKGLGIWPRDGICYAPVSGEVTATVATNHAIGLTTDDGIEVLIHIGVDTVDMQGQGFKRFVEQGDTVKAGDPLMRFDRHKIKSAGHPDIVICVVPNANELASVEVEVEGEADAGAPAIRVVR